MRIFGTRISGRYAVVPVIIGTLNAEPTMEANAILDTGASVTAVPR